MIKKALPINPKTRKSIEMLKIINAVSLVLVGLKKRLMKVPDIHDLLTELSGNFKKNLMIKRNMPWFKNSCCIKVYLEQRLNKIYIF